MEESAVPPLVEGEQEKSYIYVFGYDLPPQRDFSHRPTSCALSVSDFKFRFDIKFALKS